MTNELNMLFSSKEFVEKNKDLATQEEILAAVAQHIPGVTMEDLDTYFAGIQAAMDAPEGELAEEAMDQVAGGGVGTVIAIITFAYGCGHAIGTGIKNWKKSQSKPAAKPSNPNLVYA